MLFLLLLSAFSAEAQVTLSNGAQISNGVKIKNSGAVCAIPSVILPDAMVGTAYGPGGAGVQIQTSNCASPLIFTFTGALPLGLILSSSGLLSGIPTTPGAASFTINVLDGLGNSAIFPVSFTITAISSLVPALPDAALLNWNTLRSNTPSPGTVKTIGSGTTGLCAPAGCTYNSPTLLSTAIAGLSCGDTLEMQNTIYLVPGNLTFNKVCDQAHWITIERDFTDTNFPPELTRVTPCYSGIPSSALTGMPSYPCPSPQRDMPYIQKTASGAAINIFGTSYRFVGIEWGRDNSYDLDPGILAMANNPTDAQGNHLAPCTAPDLTCMNAQPTFNIFDQNIIHGDAQRQTSHAIGLGGTRWVAPIDSYIYDIGLTYEGGAGDAQPFAWGNGRELTNEGFGKFTNNFESASTMGNLFCGSFTEPTSPATGFDGIPTNIWFNQDWFYKNILWDTQIGQTQATQTPAVTSQTVEGVSYPAAGDQEIIITPSAVQLAAGQVMQLQTLILNDSSGGLNNIGPLSNGPSSMSVDGITNGNATVGTVFRNGQHLVGTGSFQSQNQITYQYTAPASGTHSVCYNINLSDTRAATLGANRAISRCATVTVVASPVKIMAVTPNAPDLRIQPSYSDSFSNGRQFCYTMFAFPNYSPTSITWTVDGGAGSAVVGTITAVGGSSFAGNSPSEVAYCSGTGLGAHTITATGNDGTFGSSVITVSTIAPIVGFDLKPFTSKNGFELKCGGKMLIENFFIENSWGSNGNGGGQGGQFMLIHPFNQNGCTGAGANCSTSILSGAAPLGYGPFYVKDITIRNGKALRVGAGFVIGGGANTLGLHRVSVSNVLGDDVSKIHWSHGFANSYFATQTGGAPSTVYSWESATNPMISDLSYRHITLVGDNLNTFGIAFDVAQPKPINFTMQDSFFASPNSTTFANPVGGNTVCNTAGGSGANNTEARALVPCFNGYVFNHLNLTDSTASPSVFVSSPIWQAAQASIGFVNAAAGDYRLCKGLNNPAPPCAVASIFAAGQLQHASDGGDLGPDVASIFTVELNVRNGLATPLTISTASLPDATSGSAYSTTLAVSGGSGPYQWTTPSGFIPSGAIDIMDYAAMPLTDRNNFHLTGTSVKYFRIDGGLLWWMKGASGHPWDMEMYDDRWVYQMGTEGDSSNNAVCIAAGFSSCFTDPFANKLYINPVPLWARYHMPGTMETKINLGPNKYIQTANCGADAQPAIDNQDVKGELSGPFTDVTWQSSFGGSIPDNTPYLLAVKYTKGVAGVYQNREQYWLVKGFGQVQWCPSTWNGSTFVTGSCTRETTKTAGGAPTPNFGCKVPQLQVINGLPQGVTRVSAPPMNLASATGIIDGTPTVPGSYTFTVQVEDALGRLAQKTFTLVVH